MTAPIKAPAAGICPPRTFSATSGWAAIAFSIALINAESSETTLIPRFSMISAGLPSPLMTPSTTCRASLSVNSPEVMSETISLTSEAVIGSAPADTSFSLAIRAISPSHQPRARVGSAPSFTVASTRSRTSALIIAAISLSGTCQLSCRRLRRSDGFSGNPFRMSSIHAASGATGTRSGSGK